MLIILTFDRTGRSYESSLRLGKTCLDLLTFCVFHVYEKLSFYTPCWDAFTKYGHEFLEGSQLFASLCFFFFFIKYSSRYLFCQFLVKSRNALLLSIGTVRLINFVTINLLGRFSCFSR